ncbi:MAG: tRNA pseudouridine(38-40) synthase TruA [Chloroflexi bacterium]|nr:tRNA pseudouridine(38-40) synthase TruA [Chloroflexota bacterium]
MTRRPDEADRLCCRAVVAYDGTDYAGFQRQPNGTPTVQGALEEAIKQVTGQEITVKGAGRTDSGVHASGQVIGFEVPWRHPTHDLWRAINAHLPATVVLQSLEQVQRGFHPRYDAKSREYEYTMYISPVRQPLLNKYAWHVPVNGPLDLKAMQRAASLLIGEHDFATFGQPTQGEVTIREVIRSEFVIILGSQPNVQVIRYTIAANAFLFRMVRRIVGALCRVGSCDLTVEAFEAAFRAADGTWPCPSAPAHGLCLVEVKY